MKPLSLFLALACLAGAAQARNVRIEAFGGSAYNLPTPLSIYQSGEAAFTVNARYGTHPYAAGAAPYYSARLGFWNKSDGIELEMLHHKLYLENPPAEILRYTITFGYNMFFVNYAWDLSWFILRVGLGPVITHPTNNIRGQAYSGTGLLGLYQFSGIANQVSFARSFWLAKWFFLTLEAKFTSAYAVVPIANGISTAPNFAVHGLGGIGFQF